MINVQCAAPYSSRTKTRCLRNGEHMHKEKRYCSEHDPLSHIRQSVTDAAADMLELLLHGLPGGDVETTAWCDKRHALLAKIYGTEAAPAVKAGRGAPSGGSGGNAQSAAGSNGGSGQIVEAQWLLS